MTEFLQVAELSELDAAGRLSVYFDDRAVVVFKIENAVYAVEDVCSHDGQPLTDGAVIERTVECPRHGARFDLATGRPLCMPAVEPIRVYEARIEGTRILLKAP